MKLLKNIRNFYLTLTIPLLYFAILYIIVQTPLTFPQSVSKILIQTPIQYLTLSLSFIGAGLWLACYYYLRHSFGVLPKKPIEIVKTGPYKYHPHPMYIAIFFTFTGLSLTNHSLYGFLANLIILTPINIYRAHQETKQLKKSPTPGVICT